MHIVVLVHGTCKCCHHANPCSTGQLCGRQRLPENKLQTRSRAAFSPNNICFHKGSCCWPNPLYHSLCHNRRECLLAPRRLVDLTATEFCYETANFVLTQFCAACAIVHIFITIAKMHPIHTWRAVLPPVHIKHWSSHKSDQSSGCRRRPAEEARPAGNLRARPLFVFESGKQSHHLMMRYRCLHHACPIMISCVLFLFKPNLRESLERPAESAVCMQQSQSLLALQV